MMNEKQRHSKLIFTIILLGVCVVVVAVVLINIKEKNPNQAVIVMTAFGTIETAIEAMKQGAYDYLQKPFSTEELILKLDRLMNHKKIVGEEGILMLLKCLNGTNSSHKKLDEIKSDH
jgi:DNA-binding NtrC family response regulator